MDDPHDSRAAAEIVERYARRLHALVRDRLDPAFDRRFDEEDVVQSTFRSFFVRAGDGRFECHEADGPWPLLAAIALNKLRRSVAAHLADKRSVRRTGSLADLSGFAPAGREPSASTFARLADELNALATHDDERCVLESRMAGATSAEVAEQLGCTERTVRRIVERIRERAERRAGEVPEEPSSSPGADEPAIDEADLLLHEMVGAGGVGKIYRATRRSTGEHVAVKFLRKRIAASPFVLDRFRQEAAALAELRHPGIVRIHGTGRSRGGQPFLVTEWHAGGDLESKLGRCTFDEAIRWTRSIAEAVAEAHARGIVHCDLKPANVVLGSEGPVVVDFGHAVRPAADPRSVGGTRTYLAPELRNDPTAPIDVRCDVHGVAAILFALLSGRPPEVPAVVPDEYSSLRPLLAASLAERPADRPASLAEFIGRLNSTQPA